MSKNETAGISLLLISSFYFNIINNFATPEPSFLILKLCFVFIFLYLLIFLFSKFEKTKYKNFYLFFFLIYCLIFFLKLLTILLGNFSLHYFLNYIYSYIFDLDIDGVVTIYLKIVKYCTPFFLIIIFLYCFKKKLLEIKKFLSIFGFVVSLILIWDISNIYFKNFSLNQKLKNIEVKEIKNNKKVLWILFDALDPEYINDKINNKLFYQNLNILKDKSVFHNKLYPTSNKTIYSVPSQLMGINVNNLKTKHRKIIFESIDNKNIEFNFFNTIFGDLTKQGFKTSIISSVLEYCTAYIISGYYEHCEDLHSLKKNYNIEQKFIRYNFSYIYKLKSIINDLFKFDKTKNTIINLDTNYPKIKLEEINIEKFNNINFKNSFSLDHTNLINLKKILNNLDKTNLLFLHVYSPHLAEGNSISNIEKSLKINFVGNKQYELKYFYIDLFVKKLFTELNKKFYKDIMVIISSDHWNREKGPNKKNFNSAFFLANILGDKNKFKINDASSALEIPNIIKLYLYDEINTHKDIYKIFKNSRINPITLIK